MLFVYLTVDSGASPAESTSLGLSSLEQPEAEAPDELLQLRVGRVHDLHTGFAKDPCGDPLLRGKGHNQEGHGTHAEDRGERECYPLPE